jgi:hypothetical protein
MEANLWRFLSFFYTYVYVLPLERIQLSRREGWNPINRFSTATFFVHIPSQDLYFQRYMSWPCFCSVSSVKMRGVCSFFKWLYVLGIRKKASNLAVRLELGRLPVENFIKSQTLLYFTRLYTTKLNPLLKESFLLCQNLDSQGIYLHMVFICKEYYWWDRSWYLTAPKYY